MKGDPPMSYEDVNRRAGVPIYYPLVFLLNIALIIALELLLVYKHPFPLTEEILTQQLPAYENASILRATDKTFICWNLVETETGDYHVVPVRRHVLFFNRCKLLKDQIVPVPRDTTEITISTRDGIAGSTVLVGRELAPQAGEELTGELEIRPKYYGNSSLPTYTYGFYFLLGLSLSLLEAFLWHKLKD